MKIVSHVQTFDDALHPNQLAAKKHLEKLEADILCPLAHRIVREQKYATVVEILANEIQTMRKLIQIRDDMELINGDEKD